MLTQKEVEERGLKAFGKPQKKDEFVAIPLSVLELMMHDLSRVPVSIRRERLIALLDMSKSHAEIEDIIIADLNMYNIPQELTEYLKRDLNRGPEVISHIDLRKEKVEKVVSKF